MNSITCFSIHSIKNGQYLGQMAWIFLILLVFDSLFVMRCSAFAAISKRSKFQHVIVAPSHRSETKHPKNWVLRLTKVSASCDKMDRVSLEKLTVKELKDMIKDINADVKISQLKLKSDLINFLIKENSNDVESSQNCNEESSQSKVQPKTKRPKSMPPIDLTPKPASYDKEKNPSASNPVSPKDIIFEKVYNRYPPLRHLQPTLDEQSLQNEENSFLTHMHPSLSKSFTALGENDVRQKYHPIMQGMTSSDLDIVTVGTASCVPGITRGVSCTALRLQWRRRAEGGKHNNEQVTAGIWIFDCGESTQLQIQRTGSIRPGKISKIFITHAHGDHSFGLPGLMCIMGQDRDRNSPPLEIYGPEGLRLWLRTCIRYSVSRIVPPYRVHELMDIPMAPEWSQGKLKNGRYFYQMDGKGNPRVQTTWGTKGLAGEDPVSWISRSPMLNLEPSSQFGEIPGGRDIYPTYDHPKCVDGAPIWQVEDDGDVKVYAAPMSHGIPCVGYVVEEENKPGRLRNDLVEPVVQRNIDGLRSAGMKAPMKVMGIIKDLPLGGKYTFPDGTVLTQEEVVEPPRKGRKIVICGDTADARAISGLAQEADVLVHEATNAFLSGIDKDTNKVEVNKDARVHGHSTPSIAGSFAKDINAKRLILNHFSSRYKGDQSVESISIMTRIEEEAIKSSQLPEDRVAAAWDFMILPVPSR